VKVQATRATQAVRLRHTAGFHDSHADLVAQLTPLVVAAAERGEPVAAILRPVTEEALLHALGNGIELVPLALPESTETCSGQTVAAQRARELRALTRGGARPITVVAEHISRFDGSDGGFWTELDAAMNVALAELPVTLTCFFPELPLHQSIIEGARRNHDLLLVGGRRLENAEHRTPREVLTEQPTSAPIVLRPPDIALTFGAWQLHEVRAAVERAALAADYQPDRAEDVVLAVNEVATNAVEHGGHEAELYLWTDDALICEVHDHGELSDPLPGLQPPHPADPKGRGVWIARQLCDTLHIWADGSGTHVRMKAAR
jgi:anti-sigma regulatory factor (Ser/Thr protein kinase)